MRIGSIYYINKTLKDLEGYQALKQMDSLELRKKIDILIIDDEDISVYEHLTKNNFSIHHKHDIDTIRDLHAYPIILCDIRGVGKQLGSPYEGAFVIKEAKLAYPNKQIIAYTASQYDPSFNDYLVYADSILVKGTSVDEWVSLLDGQIKNVLDQQHQWIQLRKALLRESVSTIKVAELEQNYVKAIKRGDFESFKKIAENGEGKLKNIMIEFLSSAIVKLISSGGL